MNEITKKLAVLEGLKNAGEYLSISINWNEKEGKLVAETVSGYSLSPEGFQVVMGYITDLVATYRPEEFAKAEQDLAELEALKGPMSTDIGQA